LAGAPFLGRWFGVCFLHKEGKMVRLAKKQATPVEFKLYAPKAKRVSLAGSFNSWSTDKLSAKKDTKGNWMVKVSLSSGKHEYKFFVDGSWINDPSCINFTSNPFGTKNCVVEVK
jgi:1,4-alpha-glucan branching enzyme